MQEENADAWAGTCTGCGRRVFQDAWGAPVPGGPNMRMPLGGARAPCMGRMGRHDSQMTTTDCSAGCCQITTYYSTSRLPTRRTCQLSNHAACVRANKPSSTP